MFLANFAENEDLNKVIKKAVSQVVKRPLNYIISIFLE